MDRLHFYPSCSIGWIFLQHYTLSILLGSLFKMLSVRNRNMVTLVWHLVVYLSAMYCTLAPNGEKGKIIWTARIFIILALGFCGCEVHK